MSAEPYGVKLSQTAMIVIVQYYFDHVMFADEAPKVVAVKVDDTSYGTVHFEVVTEPKADS